MRKKVDLSILGKQACYVYVYEKGDVACIREQIFGMLDVDRLNREIFMI